MKLKLITIGTKMPSWIQTGYQEYAKRLPLHCQLELIEIPLKTRSKNVDIQRLINAEGDAMLNAIEKNDHVVALTIQGQSHTTEALAAKLTHWQQFGNNIALLIGGPEGLAPQCIQRANENWSLSALTLPHPLVRVIVAEQIYRACSLLQGHPYHK